jgi:hypothetical protein
MRTGAQKQKSLNQMAHGAVDDGAGGSCQQLAATHMRAGSEMHKKQPSLLWLWPWLKTKNKYCGA